MFGGSNYTLFRYFLALKIIRLSLYLFTTLNLSGRNGEMFQAICMKNKLNSSLSPHKDVRGYNKKHLVTLQPPKDRGGAGGEWAIENQKRYFSGTKCLIELKFKFVCCVEHYLSFLNGCSLGFFNTCLKNGHTVALVRASPRQVTHTVAVGKLHP